MLKKYNMSRKSREIGKNERWHPQSEQALVGNEIISFPCSSNKIEAQWIKSLWIWPVQNIVAKLLRCDNKVDETSSTMFKISRKYYDVQGDSKTNGTHKILLNPTKIQ